MERLGLKEDVVNFIAAKVKTNIRGAGRLSYQAWRTGSSYGKPDRCGDGKECPEGFYPG